MHWLPLVAMVIASALPFPHNPVSRITAATTEPGSNNRREQRHDPAVRLAAPTVDNDFDGNALQTDYDMAAALSPHTNGQNLQNHKDDVKSSALEETSTFKVENQGNYQSSSDSGSDGKSSVSSDVSTEGRTHRTEDISEDNSLTKDYKADSRSSSSSNFLDFSKKDTVQDSENPMLQVSAAENPNSFNSASTPKGPKGPEPPVPSEQGSKRVQVEESFTLEAGLGLGTGLDNILEGGKMFLDAHPRVLFSPSLSPPEHPPLLLMLESGQLEEDGGVEEQEDMDGHIEGHGDRAIDRSAGWADSSRGTSEGTHANKRDKRSHPIDRRRGEKSVCESESFWVTDKKNATDWNGRNVTILQEIPTQNGPLKQYFYETRCRQPEPMSSTGKSRSPPTGVAGAGCLGVDKKQWLSECKAKQSYVRALTKDANNKNGWRWIRIDSSCVCVLLSRANQASGREVLMRKGRG